MRLTNRLNLPRSIEAAVRNDRYSRGDAHISVTGLLAPARKRALEIKHAAEITEDVAERIWALMGQIAHGILERADDQAWCEERLFIERHGWRISGAFDRYLLEENGRLQDYKMTSSYAIMVNHQVTVKPEWTAQENIYALMLREHGYTVSHLEVVAILRDWQKAKAKHDERYPQVPALIIPVEMWPAAVTEDYIRARLLAHGKAQTVLPKCTAEERWERPGVYALTKRGDARATSIHPTREAAEAALDEAGGEWKTKRAQFEIRERPAEQQRCADYCPVLNYCEQGQRLIKQAGEIRLEQNWSISGPRASAAE